MEIHNYLKQIAIDKLETAFSLCPAEILYLDSANVIIFVPKFFKEILGNEDIIRFRGYEIRVGYELSIVFFNINSVLENRVFKFKI